MEPLPIVKGFPNVSPWPPLSGFAAPSVPAAGAAAAPGGCPAPPRPEEIKEARPEDTKEGFSIFAPQTSDMWSSYYESLAAGAFVLLAFGVVRIARRR